MPPAAAGCDLRIHTAAAPDMLDEDLDSQAMATQYDCLTCAAVFPSLALLGIHLRAHLTAPVTPSSPCTAVESPIDQRLRTFKCTFPDCPAAFARIEHLRRHAEVHDPERRFKCPHEGCPKAFTQQGHLKYHLNTHADPATRVKKFECDICHRALCTKQALKGHLAKVHGVADDRTLVLPRETRGSGYNKRMGLISEVAGISAELKITKIRTISEGKNLLFLVRPNRQP
ncbi:hypothetical protein HDU82_008687 [Entophlyctis luteolus]|nr:hypothetical protein HDU82_008687 [Entophlyctis luteolus]